MAVERLGLTERLRPKEAEQIVPSLGEAEPDYHRRREGGEDLDGPNQAKLQGRDGASEEGACARGRDRGCSDEIDVACQQAEIAPRIEEHEARRRGEEAELAQEQTPEHLRVAEGLEPEQVGEPVQRRQHDHEQEDDYPQQSSWGEEPQQRAHRVGRSLGPVVSAARAR